MGHTHCGAVKGTLDALASGEPAVSENVQDIVSRIAPAVSELVRDGKDKEQLVQAATRANVRASANHLRHGSRILEQRISSGQLLIVGAEYELESGRAHFFDGMPQ